MNYWHMQLHPNDKNWGREIELLENKSIIGLGNWTDGESQINKFKGEMEIGDIVLIKRGSIPLALVQVDSDFVEKEKEDYTSLDWFTFERKVKILDIVDEFKKDFPQPRMTLQKAKSKDTPSFQYINNWYKYITNDKNENLKGLKLKKLYIKNYKMFKNLNISFDKENKPLPLIVIAGINGTGKTSLLEYIYNITTKFIKEDESYIKFEMYDEDKEKKLNKTLDFENLLDVYNIGSSPKQLESKSKEFYEDNIIYLKTDTHYNISFLEEDIVKYLKQLVWEDDNQPSDVYLEVKNFINNIFSELDLNIEFDSLSRDEKIYFVNKVGEKFTLDEVSTGEKTLLTKVLYLFMKNYRDKVILIDEPELSLHPTWQNKILNIYEQFAEEFNCQIILATHSPHIIGSVKPDCLKILERNNDNTISVINNIEYSYGLEVDKILTEIMGLDSTRTPTVAKDISKLWEYLEDEDYESEEFLTLYNSLEEKLGSLDKELVLARLEIAKLKAENA